MRSLRALMIVPMMLAASGAILAADQVAQPPIIRNGASAFGVFVTSDTSGNTYVAGSFDGSLDFNPFIGDDTKSSGGALDIFVTRFNANGTYAWTQTWGGATDDDVATAIAVSNNRVYVTGAFRSDNAGFGGSGSISTTDPSGTDAIVLCMNAATGAPDLNFNGDGIEQFGGIGSSFGQAIVVASGVVYVGGDFNGLNVGFGGVGGAFFAQADDFFIFALDGTTGALVTTFATNGIYLSGVNDSEFLRAMTVANGTLYAVGGAIGKITGTNGKGDRDAFVLALDAATGLARNFGAGGSGVQVLGGSGYDEAHSVCVSSDGTTIYLGGYFDSSDAVVGTGVAPTIASNGLADAFVMALAASDGSPLLGFGSNGVQTFGGTADDFQIGNALTFNNGVVYMAGQFASTNALIGPGGGGTISTTGMDDTFILALDGGTGAAVTGFSGDGVQLFTGISGDDRAYGATIVGQTLVVSGITFSNPVKLGTGGNIPNQGLNGFLLRLGFDGNFAVPVITSQSTASATQGALFSFNILASNNPTSYFATGLPMGLSVNMTTGVISGTPTETGPFSVGISVANASGTGVSTLTLTVNPPPPVVNSQATATATRNATFNYMITATNMPTSFGVTGLPAGLSIVTSTGQISGTPTVEGTFDLVISASNVSGTGTAALQLQIRPPVPLITSSLTQTGTQNQPYTYSIIATGAPTSFNATGLPAGLTVNTTTGVISGVPTTLGPSTIMLSATNTSGTGTATLNFNVVLANAPALTSLSRTSALPGEPAFTLTVTGSNFLVTSQVFWNGVARATTFDSATQLRAAVLLSDLANPGRASVTAVNPSPGGGTSNTIFFSVYNGTVGRWVVKNTDDAGVDSLRFCLQSAKSGDTVTFDDTVFALANSDAATIINVESELPPLDDGSVTVDAQNQRVTVNGSGASSAAGMVITSSNNTVSGLALIGFPKSGIRLSGGAASNLLGGNRNTGTGPNGQGLRLASNGAFGIEINGAGTDANLVKGCWIGLAASGSDAQPNLAGILIQGGAKQNVIGGTVAGEENAISGNTFEGLTVSGTGTDDNACFGNQIGVPAIDPSISRAVATDAIPTRGSANGSAGVFLSKGTQNSRVGGTAARQGNTIAFNGGNGIEVRSTASRGNSSTTNRITKNVRGGITLFDGSNGGVKRPTFTSVETIPGRTSSVPGAVTVRVQGTASTSGSVEVFNDDGSQGSRFLGRVSVAGGVFDVTVDRVESQNVTATLTDDGGNTSTFAVFGSGVAGGDSDSDGDGISDALESLAGSDPNNAAETPTTGAAPGVDKADISLNFAKQLKDSIKVTARLTLPAGFLTANAGVGLSIGGFSERVVLDANGKAPKGTASASVKFKGSGKDPAPAGTEAVVTFSVKGRTLAAAFASTKLTDRTTGKTGESVDLPVGVALVSGSSRVVYTGQVTVSYKATQGKSGKAKK